MVSAKICFLGNRIFYSKYRPLIKIRDDNMFNSCELVFKNQDMVYSGEEIEASIVFLNEANVVDYLFNGKFFLMYEGAKLVGKGEIIDYDYTAK
jgi:hypothetical protein